MIDLDEMDSDDEIVKITIIYTDDVTTIYYSSDTPDFEDAYFSFEDIYDETHVIMYHTMHKCSYKTICVDDMKKELAVKV